VDRIILSSHHGQGRQDSYINVPLERGLGQLLPGSPGLCRSRDIVHGAQSKTIGSCEVEAKDLVEAPEVGITTAVISAKVAGLVDAFETLGLRADRSYILQERQNPLK
jgi:hypothetical protein